jgi:hypothetical protein
MNEQTGIDRARAKFEAWMTGMYRAKIDRYSNGVYRDERVESLWKGYWKGFQDSLPSPETHATGPGGAYVPGHGENAAEATA